MKHVIITYRSGRQIEFEAEELFYKTEWGWLNEIGYYPKGKSRKKWHPIGGRRDDRNDYTGTKVVITEI